MTLEVSRYIEENIDLIDAEDWATLFNFNYMKDHGVTVYVPTCRELSKTLRDAGINIDVNLLSSKFTHNCDTLDKLASLLVPIDITSLVGKTFEYAEFNFPDVSTIETSVDPDDREKTRIYGCELKLVSKFPAYLLCECSSFDGEYLDICIRNSEIMDNILWIPDVIVCYNEDQIYEIMTSYDDFPED